MFLSKSEHTLESKLLRFSPQLAFKKDLDIWKSLLKMKIKLGHDNFLGSIVISVEFSSKKDLTVKSQFPAVRQSILYGGKKVWVLPSGSKRLNYSADSYWFVV